MSELLEKILKKNSVSIRNFAIQLELSRPFVQNVIGGKKKMSKNMLDRILALDWVSAEDKMALQNAFFESHHDVDYAQIKFFLNHVSNFNNFCKPVELIDYNEEEIRNKIYRDAAPYCAQTRKDILELFTFLIKDEISKDKPIFYSNLSPNFKELDDIVYSILFSRDYDKPFDFKRLFALYPEVSEDFIYRIFDIARYGYIQLQSLTKFTYTLGASTAIFPYYIILSDAVIIFNRAASRCIVLTEETSVSYYKETFLTNAARFTNFDRICNDEIEIMQYIREQTGLKYAIDGYTCLNMCLDKDILNAVAREDLPAREYLIHSLVAHYGDINSNPVPVFQTKASLEKFAETGDIQQITNKYINIFPDEQRVNLFTNLLKCIENGSFDQRILNDIKFNPANNVALEIHNDSLYFEVIYDEESNHGNNKKYCYYLVLPTFSINGLDDFLDSVCDYLIDCRYALPQEVNTRIIQDLISKIRLK